MNKRIAAAIVTAALALAPLLAAPAAGSPAGAKGAAGEQSQADQADVVVLLDLSQSALPYFQDVSDYVVSSVVKDYLRWGDTFHLLSFGETTQVEIAQRVTSEGDVKSVLGRLYLLYPLARYSDLVGALGYLSQYLADLPESRPKMVVVITDGVHNPPPGSRTYGMAPEGVSAAIEAAAAGIRANGWPVRIIKLPFPKPGEAGAPAASAPESKGSSFLAAAAAAMGATVSEYSREGAQEIAGKSLAIVKATFPGPLGKRDYAFSFPLTLENGSDGAVMIELDGARLGAAEVLSKKAFAKIGPGRSATIDVPVLLPDSVPEGAARLPLGLHFANGVRVKPDQGVLDLTLEKSPLAAFLRGGARIAFFIAIMALGLAAVFLLVLLVRRMPRRAEAPIAAAVLGSEAKGPAQAEAATASGAVSASGKRGALAAAPSADRRAPKAAPAAALVGGTASTADAKARAASADAEARAMDKGRQAEAAEAAALLAEAARAARAEREASSLSASARRPAPAPASDSAGGGVAGKAPRESGLEAARAERVPRGPDARQAEIESSTAALARRDAEETKAAAKTLAEAARRNRPARRPSSEEASRARSAAATFGRRSVKPGSIEIELMVEDQNPHIGSRNVHTMASGGSKTVGGGASDFLVFLVSVPRHCAELRYDGEKLAFVPLRPELFPDLPGPVEDCLGKEIQMISRSGYPLKLRFAAYERPADKVNKLLHCIDTVGI
jgi:hypothetical protein